MSTEIYITTATKKSSENSNEVTAALAQRTDHNADAEAAECRTPSCHSRIATQRVITEDGTTTLCRSCRKQYFAVSS